MNKNEYLFVLSTGQILHSLNLNGQWDATEFWDSYRLSVVVFEGEYDVLQKEEEEISMMLWQKDVYCLALKKTVSETVCDISKNVWDNFEHSYSFSDAC